LQKNNECIATTYYISQVPERPNSTCLPYEIQDENAGPIKTVVSNPVSNDEPAAVEKPSQSIPECITPAPTVTATPENVEKPPTKITETPAPKNEDVPDLGLVKATETVVKLALSGDQTGNAYEGAAVKLLQDEPPLRLADAHETALTATEAYASDVAGGYSDKDGSVTITPVQPTTSETTNQQNNEKPNILERKIEVQIDENKMSRVIVAMKPSVASKKTINKKVGLPGELAQPGLDVCIAHSFQIGQQTIFVASVLTAKIEEFKRAAEQADGVSSVEVDPCRHKEELDFTD
jgi:hypothetical protein